MRIAPIVIADLVSTPAVALNCSEAVNYRQVTEGVTGWNQILPVAPEDAVVADFGECLFLDLTINGETTRYTTTIGGTGIRTRAAYVPDDDNAKIFGYTMFDTLSASPTIGLGTLRALTAICAV